MIEETIRQMEARLGASTNLAPETRAELLALLTKLRETDWNVSETARLLYMPRSNLYKKIERYSLTRESTPESFS